MKESKEMRKKAAKIEENRLWKKLAKIVKNRETWQARKQAQAKRPTGF